MSQNKVMEEQASNMEDSNNGSNTRIQTRRASRPTRSASPVVKEEEEEEEEEEEAVGSPVSSTGEGVHSHVIRSQSVESSGYETADSRKRKRRVKSNSSNSGNSKQKRADSYQPSSHTLKNINTPSPTNNTASPAAILSNNSQLSIKEENERETRNTTQRMSKEAREAKKAQRDSIIKERLGELDKLEKAVKDGSHSEYHKLLANIEEKRTNMLTVAKMRKFLAEGTVTNFFNSQKYAAYSQYYWDKLALRRSMIQHVQHKINILEQEFYSNHVQSSLDEEHLSEWIPPNRPSMISSLTLGLTEEDIDNDIEWAKQDPCDNNIIMTTTLENPHHSSLSSPPPQNNNPAYYRRDIPTTNAPPPDITTTATERKSPPLDMLASLADRQYQKDFKEESNEKPFTLPPLNPWRYGSFA